MSRHVFGTIGTGETAEPLNRRRGHENSVLFSGSQGGRIATETVQDDNDLEPGYGVSGSVSVSVQRAELRVAVLGPRQGGAERVAEENSVRLSGPVEGQGKSHLPSYRVGDVGRRFVHESGRPVGPVHRVGFQSVVSSLPHRERRDQIFPGPFVLPRTRLQTSLVEYTRRGVAISRASV